MIPFRPAALFRSRWSALFWAAGVLWFASDVAGHPDRPTDTNAAGNATTARTNDGGDADSLDVLQNQVHAFEAMK